MPDDPKSFPGVMISSTFTDLKEHRDALIDTLLKQGLHPVAMEHNAPRPGEDVISASLRMVREASAYIGLISHRYGEIPDDPDRNPDRLSISRLEFDEAQRLARPTLVFIMGDGHPVLPSHIDKGPAQIQKLEDYRTRAKAGRIYEVFDSLNDFEKQAIHGAANLRRLLDNAHLAALLNPPLNPVGHRWKREGDQLVPDSSGDEADATACTDPIVAQLHKAARRHAGTFLRFAVRLDNVPAWTGIADATQRLIKQLEPHTADLPAGLGYLYDAILELGGFLDQDNGFLRLPDANADPLAPEARRALETLIRTAAPWARRFPTIRDLDDAAGAFLTRRDLLAPASEIIAEVVRAGLIPASARQQLETLREAGSRESTQGAKAASRFVGSTVSLVLFATSELAAFELGMAGNIAAEHSAIANKIATVYVNTESATLRLFEEAPADIRTAIAEIIHRIIAAPRKLVPLHHAAGFRQGF